MNTPAPARLDFFERHLTLWVLACMAAGLALGRWLPELTASLSALEFGRGSHVNAPIAILIWLMVGPMMLRIDFSSLAGVWRRPAGIGVTLFVNWLVKPFSMALLAWLCLRVVAADGLG